jgi:hypothetical protein
LSSFLALRVEFGLLLSECCVPMLCGKRRFCGSLF